MPLTFRSRLYEIPRQNDLNVGKLVNFVLQFDDLYC